jgi:predicted nucleotidyltransferase
VTAAHAYPTPAHQRAARAITGFFSEQDDTDAVLLVNSCARGKATPDSCLDMQVIVPPEAVPRVDADFRRFVAESEEVVALLGVGRFSDLHLDVIDGLLEPGPIDEEGVDWFEVAVGNLFVYSVPLFVRGDRLERLRAPWLPYYGEALRRERLETSRWFVLDVNLARIPWLLDRDLYFQAFDRFYRAFQGFLLSLHISRRTYPIAYNKWIREQVVCNLGLPELYARLPTLFELDRFESRALEAKAQDLRDLVDEHVLA